MRSEATEFLVFSLGEESYALPILAVQEVVRYMPVTKLRDGSKYLRGVVNLRGRIVPIVDLRQKFGMERREFGERTVFIVASLGAGREGALVGLAVDAVREVCELEREEIQATPELGFRLRARYVTGIVRRGEGITMIIDLAAALSGDEAALESAAAAAAEAERAPAQSAQSGGKDEA